MFKILFVLGAFCISNFNVRCQSRNLCDLCECAPSFAEPTYVNCNCKKNKLLIIKEEDGELLSNTKVLNISACNFLSFPQNGFLKTKKLKTLQIRQMKLFHLNAGFFPSVSNLVIEDISELIIDGFHGQENLASIEIKNSCLSELTEDSFKDLKTLEKLTFQDVSVTTIATGSLIIPSNVTKPSIRFVNCKIDTIQSDGISAHVTKLEFLNCTLDVINSNGISIQATDTIDIIRNTFGPLLAPDSFAVRSNRINFVENEFSILPSSFLKDIQTQGDRKINFVNNLIHDIDLGGFLLSKLDKLNFIKNKIVCDCSPRKTSILKLKELFPGLLTNETFFDVVVEQNSCKNYNGIGLGDFKRKFLAGVICNETDVKMLESYAAEQQTEWFRTDSPNRSNIISPLYYVVAFGLICKLFLTR